MTTRGDALLVYLADLTHTGVRVATESFPLNIGLVASYAKRHRRCIGSAASSWSH